MALNFPSTPSANATYTFNDKTWTYTGEAWALTTGGALNTAVVPEGSNLYFTNARATTAITRTTLSNITVSGAISVADVTATGNITAPNLYAYSDESLKTDIVRINDAIEKVQALNGVYFTWKKNNQKSMGLIAQQVEAVEPVVVTNTPEGFKAVNYASLVGLLVEAIKDQQIQIEDLKDRIDKL
jgi:hypothetical protein